MRTLPPPLTISDDAAAHFKALCGPAPVILISINKKGCAGGEYQFEAFNLADMTAAHESVTHNGVTIVFQKLQLLQLIGSQIVLTKNAFETRIDLQNPQEISRCGCGESVQLAGINAQAGTTAPCGASKPA